MKNKVFLTGSTGFIGRNLREYLEKDYNLISPTHRELDLLDDLAVQKFLEKNRFHTIIHAATHDATGLTGHSTSEVFINNIRMFTNLTRYHKLFGRMFYFGSGAEYGMKHFKPQMEEGYFGTYVPEDQYGFSKYIMAKYTESFPNIYDLVLFGVFGKYELWERRFISQNICRALLGLDIVINKDREMDYVYIDDLIPITAKFIEADNLKFRRYNICSGKTVKLSSIARIIQKISGNQAKIQVRENGYQEVLSGDMTRLTEELGPLSFSSMEESVKKLYLWYQSEIDSIDRRKLP